MAGKNHAPARQLSRHSGGYGSIGVHNVRVFLPDHARQFAHRAQRQFLTGILKLANPDMCGKQTFPQTTPERQRDGNGKFAAVQMAQNIQKLNPRAADIAVGDDI